MAIKRRCVCYYEIHRCVCIKGERAIVDDKKYFLRRLFKLCEHVSKEDKGHVQNCKLLQHLYYFCSIYVYSEQYAYFLWTETRMM